MQTVERLSHVTVYESAVIRATLHAVDDVRFLCSKCKPTTRESKGCTSISKNVRHELEPDLKFRTCPGNFFSHQTLNFLEMHHQFESGVLPYRGSLGEQPNKIIEIFRVIGLHRSRTAEIRRKKAELDMMTRRARG